MQKLVLVRNHNADALNSLLSEGWIVKDYKPISNYVADDVYAYVLIEKKDKESEMEIREPIPGNKNSGMHSLDSMILSQLAKDYFKRQGCKTVHDVILKAKNLDGSVDETLQEYIDEVKGIYIN